MPNSGKKTIKKFMNEVHKMDALFKRDSKETTFNKELRDLMKELKKYKKITK